MIQTIETLVRRKPNQHFIDSSTRRSQNFLEIIATENIHTNRILLESPVQSPTSGCRMHHLEKKIDEEEEISSLPSIANELDQIPDFEFSPRSKSVILVQTINQDKIHDTL